MLLCPLHHRAVHEGDWRVEMDENGVPRFFNPLGVHMPEVPQPPDIGGLLPGAASPAPSADGPAPARRDYGLARWHGQRGIGPSAGGALWRGERIDWGWALACLWREGGDGVADGWAGGSER